MTLKLLLQIIQCKEIQDQEKRKGWNEWMQVPLAFIDFYTTPKSLSIQFSQAETTWKERVGNDLRLNNNSSVQTKNISLTSSASDSQELGVEWFWNTTCEYKCSSSSTVTSPLLRAIETGYCNLLWKQPWNSEGVPDTVRHTIHLQWKTMVTFIHDASFNLRVYCKQLLLHPHTLQAAFSISPNLKERKKIRVWKELCEKCN